MKSFVKILFGSLLTAGLLFTTMGADCGNDSGSDGSGSSNGGGELDKISATMWKKLPDNPDSAKVHTVVRSGSSVYAASSDKNGLYFLDGDKWAKVNLKTGKIPSGGAQDIEDSNVMGLHALSGDRVVFYTNKGVGIAKGKAATVAWLNAATGIGGAAVTDLTVGKSNTGKEAIFVTSGQASFAAQLDVGTPAAGWTAINGSSSNAHDKVMAGLFWNKNGTDLFVGHLDANNAAGLLNYAKTALVLDGKSDTAKNTTKFSGHTGNAHWAPAALPDNLVHTSKGFITRTGSNLGFVTTANATGGTGDAVAAPVGGTAVTDAFKIERDGDGALAYITDKGMIGLDSEGKLVAAKKFEGKFADDNFADMSDDDLKTKKKSELTTADLGTKKILNMYKDGDFTYYVTEDKGIWAGEKKDIEIKKD